jgi:hypothetical protein
MPEPRLGTAALIGKGLCSDVYAWGEERARAGRRRCEDLASATQQFRLGDTEMTATAVLEFLALMEASSIDVCIDGGVGPGRAFG